MPDPLSSLLGALTGRKRDAPGEIGASASSNTGNALSALLDSILGTVGDNLGGAASSFGNAAGAVAGPLARAPGHLAGDLRSGFNSLPLVPDIGGGNRNAGKVQGPEGSRISLSPAEIAGLVSYQPSSNRRSTARKGAPSARPTKTSNKTAKSRRRAPDGPGPNPGFPVAGSR